VPAVPLQCRCCTACTQRRTAPAALATRPSCPPPTPGCAWRIPPPLALQAPHASRCGRGRGHWHAGVGGAVQYKAWLLLRGALSPLLPCLATLACPTPTPSSRAVCSRYAGQAGRPQRSKLISFQPELIVPVHALSHHLPAGRAGRLHCSHARLRPRQLLRVRPSAGHRVLFGSAHQRNGQPLDGVWRCTQLTMTVSRQLQHCRPAGQ